MTQYLKEREKKILKYVDSIKSGYRKFPPSLQIAITDSCFNQCITCDHWKIKQKSKMDLNVLLSFLEVGKMNGLQSVCYSGGDPFAYPFINEVMSWHIGNDINFGIITSGHVPRNVDIGKASKAAWIRVSIDSISHYSSIRKGMEFDTIDKSVRDLLSAGANIGIGITLQRLNQDSIHEICVYAAERNIKEVRVWPVREEDGLSATKDAIRYLSRCIPLLDLYGIDNNFTETIEILEKGKEAIEFNHCFALFYQLFIGASGEIWPCGMTAGDSRDKSHMESLGNISNWDNCLDKIRGFNKISKEALPDICKNQCTLRLSSINQYFEKYSKGGEFF